MFSDERQINTQNLVIADVTKHSVHTGQGAPDEADG